MTSSCVDHKQPIPGELRKKWTRKITEGLPHSLARDLGWRRGQFLAIHSAANLGRNLLFDAHGERGTGRIDLSEQ
jgi:hypothetical protein